MNLNHSLLYWTLIKGKMIAFLTVFGCLLLKACSAKSLVQLDEGILEGTNYVLPTGKITNAFFGIPYAAPPVKELRFKSPVPVKPWKGIFNASTLPCVCLQYEDYSYTVTGEEDCLYLNVYTPKVPSRGESNPLYDVIVYIHGGAFMFGNGVAVFPNYIMKDNDIVYVSLSYRLGILGFMSSGDKHLPGNNGLKDQQLALKWIKKNILKFGGNPESITIMGSSAGGASVHYHYLSKGSKGLFKGGISFSGSVLPPWTLPKNNTEKSKHVASLAGCPIKNTIEMVECLQQRPAKQIVELARVFSVGHYEPFTTFGPVVEPHNEQVFLDSNPLDLLKNGQMNNVPWMVSLCTEEGLYRAAEFVSNEDKMNEIDKNWYDISPHMFMYNYTVAATEEKNKISDAIRKFYFGKKPLKDALKEFVQLSGDRMFYNDMTRAVKLHASTVQNAKVYCYKFAYRGKYSVSNIYARNYDDYGVSHADDVDYVVRLNSFSNSFETKPDAKMVHFMGSVIKNFMKTGIAQVDVTKEEWEPISRNLKDKMRCLEINSPDELKMVDFEDTRTLNFWAKLLPSEHPEYQVDMTRKEEL